MDRLTRLELDLKNLLKEVDELTLNENGEEREGISLEEYEKIEQKESELRDLKKMIEGEKKLRGMKEELSQPQPEPVTKQEPVEQRTEQGFESFGHYLQAVIRASIPSGAFIGDKPTGVTDKRLLNIKQAEQRAASGMSEGVPADGGFLLQTEYMDELVTKIHNTGKLASRCRQIAISPKVSALKIPGVDESSRADGSRHGGIRAYWTSEAAEKEKSKPKFRQINLEPQKLTGLVYLTDELMQDVDALGTFVSDIMTEEFGFKIDDAIINGTR
jgi:HK97 family phage major capsid protein